MGGFINNNEELYQLRLNTVRSHVQASWPNPVEHDFGKHYTRIMKQILDHQDQLMCKRIPLMAQAYFEDMQQLFWSFSRKMRKGGIIYFNVANSAYFGVEVPVDYIIGDIAEENGFTVKEIRKARDLKTSPQQGKLIGKLRESVLVMERS